MVIIYLSCAGNGKSSRGSVRPQVVERDALSVWVVRL